jgi:hypothetical protein
MEPERLEAFTDGVVAVNSRRGREPYEQDRGRQGRDR